MKSFYLLPIYFISFSLCGQDWQNYLAARNQHEAFIEQIKKGTDWDSILHNADTSLLSQYSFNIQQTIELLKSPMVNAVDSFFHVICSEWYSEFPYRVSGHLRDELFILYEKDTSDLNRIVEREYGKNLYPKASPLINKPANESIPHLMKYLDNQAATRLVIPPWDWDEPSFFLTVSDMAMELIEIITWCDFYDNASSVHLFSNLALEDQDTIIATIHKWYEATLDLPKNEAAVYFLDSICPYGYSFTFTCENLLYLSN
jgi:hypothetical protein